jgi:hypothetical protein
MDFALQKTVMSNRNDLLRIRFRLRKSFGSGSALRFRFRSRIQTIIKHICQKTKNCTKSCLLIVSEPAYLPECLPLIFDFFGFFITFNVASGSKSGSGNGSGTGIVIPEKKHYLIQIFSKGMEIFANLRGL